MRSTFLRRSLIVAAAAVALVAMLAGAAHLPFVRARVLAWAQGYAAREFGVVVNAEDLSYDLLGVSVELRNLDLAAPGQPSFLKADGLRLVLGRGLYTGTVDIQSLAVRRPHVTLVRHRDGSTNLPVVPSAPGSKPTPLHLGIVAIEQLSVDAQDEGAGHRATVGPIDVTLDTRTKDAPPGTFGPGPLDVRIGGAGGPRTISGTLGGHLGFNGERLAMNDVRLDTAQGQLSFSGWIDVVAETARIEGRARIQADLAQAGRLIGSPADLLEGAASADVKISGPAGDPTVAVTASARNLRYQSIPPANADAEATYASGRVEIHRLTVSSKIGNASTTGSVQVLAGNAPARSQLHAHLGDLDLDRALAAGGVHLPVGLGSSADGDIDVSLDAQSVLASDWWRQLTASGSVQLTSGGTGLGIAGRLNLDVNGDRWTLAHQLQSDAGPITVSGTVAGQASRNAGGRIESTLSGRSHVRIDAIHRLTPLLQQAGLALPAPVDQLDGSLDADVDPRGTFSDPRVLATVSGRAVRLPDFPEGQIDGTVTIDRRSAKADSVNAAIGTTSLVASGTYSWSGQIDGRFEAAADDLHALAQLAGAAGVPVTGAARLAGTLQGTVQSPRARATLSARDVSAYDVAVGPVDADVRLANGAVDVDAKVPNLNGTLKGSVGIAQPYRYQAEAMLDASSIGAMLPPSLRDQLAAQGRITSTVKGQGTLDHPWDSSGEVALRALDVNVSGVPIALDAPATIAVRPDALTATGGGVGLRVGSDTHVQLSGSLGINDAGDGLNVHAEGPLSELLTMAAPAMPDVSIEARESRLGVDLHIGGTLLAPQPSGTLTLSAASLRYAGQPPLTDVSVDARIEQTRVAVESIAASWLGAKLQANGSLPLRMIVPGTSTAAAGSGIEAWGSKWLASLPTEPRSATVTGRLSGISSDALAAFVDPARLQDISGSVDATLTAEADGFSPDRIRGELVLDAASVTVADVPFTQSVPTRISLEHGHAQIEEFRWNAERNELRVSGGADLFTPERQVDLAVDGDVDLRILGAFVDGVASGGIAHSALTVKGPMTAPVVLGNVGVRGGELRLDTLGVAASDLEGTIAVAADRNATIALKGTVNGGAATLQGAMSLADITAPSGRVTLTARNVTLDYPEGFQTESNADLVLALAPKGSTLSGRVDVLSGLYREPIVVSRALLTGFGTQTAGTTANASPFLNTLGLDVAVATAEQIRIDNNYGRLNLTADLRVSGTANQPGAIGRVEAEPDGEIYLAGNTYRVESLVVDLTNPRAIAPEISFLAETRVGSVGIEISLQCSPTGQCEKDVRSQDPNVSNAEAEAMLVGLSGDATDAGAQLARLLSGELLGIVGQTFGLDTLRLEQATTRGDLFADPTLVAGDVNPASRLTIGKRLGDHVELAYSQNLAQNGFTMTTSYFAAAGISVRALLFDDQSRTYEFRHQPRFGAQRRKRPAIVSGARVAAVRFSGNPGFPESELRHQLRVAAGDPFAFTAWQADRERLVAFYQSRGFYEVRIRARRLADDGAPLDSVASDTAIASITLEYRIERGRATALEISGFEVPNRIREQIIKRWSSAIFDGFLQRDAVLIVRQYLYAENRLQATVTSTIESRDAGDSKRLRIAIDPGRSVTPQLVFEGNAAIPTETLTALAERAGPLAAWIDPESFALMVARLYHDEGLLSAEVNLQPPQVQDDVSIVRVVIHEGDAWTLGRLAVEGAAVLGDGASIDASGLSSDGHYSPKAVAGAVAGLEQRFRDAGFLNVHVTADNSLDTSAHLVNVRVVADPGPRSVLTSVVIDAPPGDREDVERTVKLEVGGSVSASDLSAARRRLYESGTYRSVDIDLTPVDAGDGDGQPLPPKAGDALPPKVGGALQGVPTDPTADRPVVAHIRVEERPRYSFRYGLAVNDDVTGSDQRSRNIGVAADLENRNLLGLGATLGMSARVRRDQEIGRVYLGVPRSFGLPLQSTLFLSRGRQNIGSDVLSKTISDVTDISAQQTYRLRKLATVSYGYGIERNRTTIEGSDFDLTVRVARLNGNAVIERRNDPFDPSRGWFTSANFELSRPGLGSELSFLRGFFQQFQFVPLPHGIVVASAVRVGLARTYRGETLIPSERFFAGGATSVRGYGDEALGARSVLGDADGGSASLIANGEVRFPIYRWLRGVGFVDLGNVYPSVSDLFHTGVQAGTGAGIRVSTPVGLIRLDLAAPANPRPLDPSWTWYFGLGHGF